jgi:hypothetical protein
VICFVAKIACERVASFRRIRDDADSGKIDFEPRRSPPWDIRSVASQSEARLRFGKFEPKAERAVDMSDLRAGQATYALRDAGAQDGAHFVDHDLRSFAEAGRGGGRERDSKERQSRDLRRDGADDDACMRGVEEIGLDDNCRAWFPIVAGENADYDVTAEKRSVIHEKTVAVFGTYSFQTSAAVCSQPWDSLKALPFAERRAASKD